MPSLRCHLPPPCLQARPSVLTFLATARDLLHLYWLGPKGKSRVGQKMTCTHLYFISPLHCKMQVLQSPLASSGSIYRRPTVSRDLATQACRLSRRPSTSTGPQRHGTSAVCATFKAGPWWSLALPMAWATSQRRPLLSTTHTLYWSAEMRRRVKSIFCSCAHVYHLSRHLVRQTRNFGMLQTYPCIGYLTSLHFAILACRSLEEIKAVAGPQAKVEYMLCDVSSFK